MQITPETKILTLIESHPGFLDFLVSYNSHFEKLKNPILRNTMGRVATVEMASAMAGVSLEQFILDLQTGLDKLTGTSKPVRKPFVIQSGLLDRAKVDVMKEIITELHEGGDFEELKGRFSTLVEDVAPHEIAAMEQQLMREGLPQTDIKRLCDVHVAMFKEQLGTSIKIETVPGHPVHTFTQENYALAKVIGELRILLDGSDKGSDAWWGKTEDGLKRLGEVEKHYLRKEYQLFPFLEAKGFTGPSQVMWAIHDDIRALFKQARGEMANRNLKSLESTLPDLLKPIEEMFFKEEHILFPVSMELLAATDWLKIKEGGKEFGYALFQPIDLWRPELENTPVEEVKAMPNQLPLDTGLLSLEQINLMLTHLPVELSFVDENDAVRYYTERPDKIFPRSPGVIGRKVQNCHPPKSLDKVNQILSDFRSGVQDHADFWIQMQGKFLYIRYFAMRSQAGEYRGALEVVQDVTEIRALEGEQRLLPTQN